MRIIRFGALAAVAALGLTLALATTADAAKKKAGKCVMAGGQGTAVGEEFAKSNALMSLNESIGKGGSKASGNVSYKCSMALLISTCTASQKACK